MSARYHLSEWSFRQLVSEWSFRPLVSEWSFRPLAVTLLLLLLCAFDQPASAQAPVPGFGSDQRPGSVLFYNIYTSSSYNTAASDTLIAVTNTSETNDVRIHFFFVDSYSCQVADTFVYLTKSQTTRFLASDIDPDVKGYLIAVAVDADGNPIQHNFLTGSLKVKQTLGPTTSSTHSFQMGAIAFAKLNAQIAPASADGVAANLVFDGGASDASYEQLPGELAIDNFESPATADTRLIIFSPKTDLYGSGESGGRLFILYYDELENSFSAMVGMNCWLQGRLTMVRNLPLRITAGQTGWAKIVGYRHEARIPLLGSVIRAAEFSGGHNLHHLNPFPSFTLTIPVFPAGL